MDNERKNIHLINELPHIYELEDMMAFCAEHTHIYIYGHDENQEYLLKYLDMCGVAVEGYVVTFFQAQEPKFCYRTIPVRLAEEILEEEGVGILLALPDRHYGKIIPMFRKAGFQDYFVLSEYNKRSIAGQVRPRRKEELAFEISLADHCNLSCQMCDHFSQLSKEWFVGVERFEKDMVRMGELFDHEIGAITLLGGEPTLHGDIIECIRIARREFPKGELIILTNGVLLLELEHSEKGNFWEVCRENDVRISVTVYPIKLDYEAIEEKGKEYGVPVFMSSNIHAGQGTRLTKISDKHTMDIKGGVERFYCVNCLYFNKFNVLKEGRLYMCPIAAHSDIFNQAFQQNLELREEDFLDIYQIQSWEEISEFTCRYVPFCRYCDLKQWGHHSHWKASSKKIEEYV
ncbi:MAG: 4Fe-4S cluster-binding domain-containing protein [Lachnospiraceae bacterium]|nr:4Fe-4S cluster-binding domain-containing protein [Lachnospiraceae bacterium]